MNRVSQFSYFDHRAHLVFFFTGNKTTVLYLAQNNVIKF